ncbi:hypothetical protein Hdeb2414_s0115g00800341 [Helianthus debilis subsp. tardiflorus]
MFSRHYLIYLVYKSLSTVEVSPVPVLDRFKPPPPSSDDNDGGDTASFVLRRGVTLTGSATLIPTRCGKFNIARDPRIL